MVDDQATNRDLLTESLTTVGYETCSASDGREGLRRLYERRPDLVITDLWMPGMDGFEFCNLVRLTCDVPIMMVTALGRMSPEVDQLSLVDAYLLKPIEIDQLRHLVKELLDQGSSNVSPTMSTSWR